MLEYISWYFTIKLRRLIPNRFLWGGRMKRGVFLFWLLFSFGFAFVTRSITLFLMENMRNSIIPFFPLFLHCVIFMFFVVRRRLHDMNRSGLGILYCFIPFVNLFFLLYLCFGSGTKWPNKYGIDPRVAEWCIVPSSYYNLIQIKKDYDAWKITKDQFDEQKNDIRNSMYNIAYWANLALVLNKEHTIPKKTVWWFCIFSFPLRFVLWIVFSIITNMLNVSVSIEWLSGWLAGLCGVLTCVWFFMLLKPWKIKIDPATEVKKIKTLYDKEVFTKQEFEKEKKKILG